MIGGKKQMSDINMPAYEMNLPVKHTWRQAYGDIIYR